MGDSMGGGEKMASGALEKYACSDLSNGEKWRMGGRDPAPSRTGAGDKGETMNDKKRYRIFSNGTQYMDWKARNCDRCAKQYDESARD